jgi:1-acyl-sn-glycerol-3-phosphate acyltransferase
MSNDPEKVISKGGIRVRKFIFPLLRAIASIISPYKLHIIRKVCLPKNTPIIFAATHGCADDIQNAGILINRHFYVLIGGLDQLLYTFDGVLAWLIGIIMIDRDDKSSRKASLLKMQRAMELGANVLIYPEGCWNLTESLLVMKLYNGVFELAKRTNALVVPIVTHLEGKYVYGILDEPFDITIYEKDEGNRILRDKLAGAKFELMEKHSKFTRSELEANETVQWGL